LDPLGVGREPRVQKRQPLVGRGTILLLKVDAKHIWHLLVVDADHFLDGDAQFRTHIFFHAQNGVAQLNLVGWVVTVVEFLTVGVVGVVLGVDVVGWELEKLILNCFLL
jgi:hypothetical protein